MITFEEALHIIETVEVHLQKEQASIIDSLGRVLASNVHSDIDMPPFDKAAVDGYACRRADLPGPLKVTEIISAGINVHSSVKSGQCAKIMTGAMVPKGADCVLMVEHTSKIDNETILFTKQTTANNIAYEAEDVRTGQLVLDKGIVLKPQHIAMLAAVGLTNPEVYKQPVIGIIATGDELVEPTQFPVGSQIRNTNAMQLMAQCKQIGISAHYYGISPDSKEATAELINSSLNEVDILLISGGISMGDFDYVPEVLEELNVNLYFRNIAVQPGKPTLFGRKDKRFVFGLPGNPVSSFVQFELLIKPLIYRFMGCEFKPVMVKLPMLTGYTRKRVDRKSFIPVRYATGKIEPLEYHGSAHIHAYDQAWGIMAINIGEDNVKPGELRDVRQL